VVLDFAVNIDGVGKVVGDLPWAVGAVIVVAIVGVGSAVISSRNGGRVGL
jgi:hypothetical protein